VSVSSNGTYEYRVKRTRWERYSWKIPTQTMTNDQKNDIKNFLVQRGHGLNSFKYVDRDQPTLTLNTLSWNSADKWNLNLAFDDTTPGTHPIFNPENTTLQVYINGILSYTGVNVEYINGQPVIVVPTSSNGDDIKVSGVLPHTVRLASDFSSTIIALDCNADPLGHSTEAISLIEVFGEY